MVSLSAHTLTATSMLRTLVLKNKGAPTLVSTLKGPMAERAESIPFTTVGGIFAHDATKHGQTKIAPSDFTIGSRLVMRGKLREALVGDMAGLAVFSRALSDEEMKTLHAAAHR